MYLVKYCSSHYNIAKECTTLRLGTLKYYQSMDPSSNIADNLEGRGNLFDKANGNTFIRSKLAPNCYIYCLSSEDIDQSIVTEQFDENYDSKFYISNPRMFVEHIKQLLEQQLTLDDFTDASKQKISSLPLGALRQFQVGIIAQPVKYVESKTYHASYSDIQSLLQEVIFTKTLKYQHDKEFRMVFLISHPELGVLDVKPKPKDLNLNVIKNYLTNQQITKGIFEGNTIIDSEIDFN